MDTNVLNTLYAIRNTLGMVNVSGEANMANMTGCFRALAGLIAQFEQQIADEAKKSEEEAKRVPPHKRKADSGNA